MLSQQQTLTTPHTSTLNLTKLPIQLQIELIDFYEFLLKKYQLNAEIEKTAKKPPRQPGCLKNQIIIHDDFDAPMTQAE